MLSLGSFVFGMATAAFQQLQRSRQWKHAPMQRVGARDSTQFLGPGDDLINLDGVLSPAIAGTKQSLRDLAKLADAGTSYVLVDGTGFCYGSFVIESMQETKTVFFDDGTPRRTEFALGLRRVDDPAQAQANA